MELVKFELYKLCKQKMNWVGLLLLFIFLGLSIYLNTNGEAAKDYALYKGYEGKINPQLVTKKQQELTEMLNENTDGISKNDLQKIHVLSDFTQAGNMLANYHEEKSNLEKQMKTLSKSSYEYREAKYNLENLIKMGEPQFYYMKAWENVTSYTDFIGTLIISVMILIGISSIFSKEYSTGMYQFILSSKNGRKKIVTAKLVVSFLYVIILTSLFFLACIVMNLLFYGDYGYNHAIRNLSGFNGTLLTLKVWQYILIEYFIYLFGALAFSTLVMFISSKSKSSLSGIIWGAAILGLPNILIQVTYGQFHWLMNALNFSYSALMSVITLFYTGNLYNVFGHPVPLVYLSVPLFAVLSILFIYGTFHTIRKKQFI
ncbi:ABC transporter permease subunit [Bacillus sp. FJAT-49736]|uniref:ABC transporter permease n=1 Tax=Bacillus sp. FJAT-49736 TaxID=2833582 RepID=UPI001BCA201D|nr:ABC transporter permease subunit [Bacillus sp. FJAT-49736]MBS4175225.1 ABC transporter permease [Bacillus sp. FJAT-49736]